MQITPEGLQTTSEPEQTTTEEQFNEYESPVLPIRCWEDPLGPAYEALMGPAFETSNARPQLKTPPTNSSGNASSGVESASGTGSVEDVRDAAQKRAGVPGPIGDWMSDLKPEHEVLIVPVFVTGGQTAEAQEKRRRVRYAVISALTTGGYRSAIGAGIRYYRPSIADDVQVDLENMYVGIEAFVPDTCRVSMETSAPAGRASKVPRRTQRISR
jgi:hypothetical protein